MGKRRRGPPARPEHVLSCPACDRDRPVRPSEPKCTKGALDAPFPSFHTGGGVGRDTRTGFAKGRSVGGSVPSMTTLSAADAKHLKEELKRQMSRKQSREHLLGQPSETEMLRRDDDSEYEDEDIENTVTITGACSMPLQDVRLVGVLVSNRTRNVNVRSKRHPGTRQLPACERVSCNGVNWILEVTQCASVGEVDHRSINDIFGAGAVTERAGGRGGIPRLEQDLSISGDNISRRHQSTAGSSQGSTLKDSTVVLSTDLVSPQPSFLRKDPHLTRPAMERFSQQRYLVNEKRAYLQLIDDEAKALSLLAAYSDSKGDTLTATRVEKAAKQIHDVSIVLVGQWLESLPISVAEGSCACQMQAVEMIKREDHRLGKLRRRKPLQPLLGRGLERDHAIAQGLSVSKLRLPEPPKAPLPERRLIVRMVIISTFFLVMLFLPSIFVQFHVEPMLTSASYDSPGFVDIPHLSNHVLEVHILGQEAHGLTDHDGLPEIEVGVSAEQDNTTLGGPHLYFLEEDEVSEELITLDIDGFDGGESMLKVTSTSIEPAGFLVETHDLGPVGNAQEIIALKVRVYCYHPRQDSNSRAMPSTVIHRALAAMIGAGLVIFFLAAEHRMPELDEIVTWMDIPTLSLLWGMMVIVGILAETGVFEWSAVKVFGISKQRPGRLLILLCVFDAVLSAFLDNVTTILLMAPVVISLCKAVDVNPKLYLISLALFGNIGGTATMIGDPPNIIIGSEIDEVDFVDFLVYLAPPTFIIILPVSLVIVYFYYRREMSTMNLTTDITKLADKYSIRDRQLLIKSGSILVVVLLGFFLSTITEVDPAYVAIFGAVFTLVLYGDFEHALDKVEWDTLLFFAALFVFTEGLAELGLLRQIARILSTIIEGVETESRQQVAIVLIQWVAAIVSAFVDNIPFTTTMIPVIQDLADDVEGVALEVRALGDHASAADAKMLLFLSIDQPLAWALAFGADLGGMGTLVGSSANVVMAGIADEAHYHVGFVEFMKLGFPLMIVTVAISQGWLLVLDAARVWD
eukprot:scaffold4_cov396-Prasinococcus_capsulatus_cf.AAC.28